MFLFPSTLPLPHLPCFSLDSKRIKAKIILVKWSVPHPLPVMPHGTSAVNILLISNVLKNLKFPWHLDGVWPPSPQSMTQILVKREPTVSQGEEEN